MMKMKRTTFASRASAVAERHKCICMSWPLLSCSRFVFPFLSTGGGIIIIWIYLRLLWDEPQALLWLLQYTLWEGTPCPHSTLLTSVSHSLLPTCHQPAWFTAKTTVPSYCYTHTHTRLSYYPIEDLSLI